MKKIPLLLIAVALPVGFSCYANDMYYGGSYHSDARPMQQNFSDTVADAGDSNRLNPPRYSETITDASRYGAGNYRTNQLQNYNPLRNPLRNSKSNQRLQKTTSGSGIDQGPVSFGDEAKVSTNEWSSVTHEWENVSGPQWAGTSQSNQWGSAAQSGAAKLFGQYAHQSAVAAGESATGSQEEKEEQK